MNLCDREVLRALLGRHGFHFSKSMGQNFLIDPEIPADIAAASQADGTCGVLEIGPGVGCLTAELAKRAGKVVSIELDKKLLPVLAETMEPFDNVEIVPGDALKLDLSALAAEKFSGLRPLVCANLPYNITTPVLTRLVETPCFESITVLLQKEVAHRLAAPRCLGHLRSGSGAAPPSGIRGAPAPGRAASVGRLRTSLLKIIKNTPQGAAGPPGCRPPRRPPANSEPF